MVSVTSASCYLLLLQIFISCDIDWGTVPCCEYNKELHSKTAANICFSLEHVVSDVNVNKSVVLDMNIN